MITQYQAILIMITSLCVGAILGFVVATEVTKLKPHEDQAATLPHFIKMRPTLPPPGSESDPLWETIIIDGEMLQAPMARYLACINHCNRCPFCNTAGLELMRDCTCPNCGRAWPPAQKYFREHFDRAEYIRTYDGALPMKNNKLHMDASW